MVAFAVGGLLGDTLFHLLPEIFLGEVPVGEVRFVMVEPNRNLLLGVAIMVGFVAFVALDKGLRIATGGEGGHGHSHSHSHSHENTPTVTDDKSYAAVVATGTDKPSSSKNRKKPSSSTSSSSASNGAVVPTPSPSHGDNPSVKLAGLLNLLADFTHNITDGLALSSSFYASPTLGATTCVAVFFHEIPHEVGDFALLIQSGFSKRAAMGAQFVTALGALLGTGIGICVQEFSKSEAGTEGGVGMTSGIWGTSLGWGDMLLPFTAGTFLYVGTVAVIPELLECGAHKKQELWKTGKQFAAMAAGAGIMLYISWA
jgi:zinc transporter 7